MPIVHIGFFPYGRNYRRIAGVASYDLRWKLQPTRVGNTLQRVSIEAPNALRWNLLPTRDVNTVLRVKESILYMLR